ncbi:MAG: hypothetical protein ACTHNS_02665 [Marmoricola sp.]
MLVASANVQQDLPIPVAREAVQAVLDEQPDLVGLQEWRPDRFLLLRTWGAVGLAPGTPAVPGSGTSYDWVTTPFGCVVGARADRFRLLSARWGLLNGVVAARSPYRPLGLEPPRMLAIGRYRDERTGRAVTMICYHLVPGVQAGKVYRTDQPRLVALHRAEHVRLQRAIDEAQECGDDVYAVGDANFDGFFLEGVTSCWVGHEDAPPTFGKRRRHIDDVFGPGPASSVRLLTTASDHKAVLADRPDFSDPAALR